MSRTTRLFPDYDLTLNYTGDKVEITLVTNVRVFEVNTQKWFLTQHIETSKCNHDKVVEGLNSTMQRFLKHCYTLITVGFPGQSIVDKNGNPLFNPDDSQISEKERMKDILKKMVL